MYICMSIYVGQARALSIDLSLYLSISLSLYINTYIYIYMYIYIYIHIFYAVGRPGQAERRGPFIVCCVLLHYTLLDYLYYVASYHFNTVHHVVTTLHSIAYIPTRARRLAGPSACMCYCLACISGYGISVSFH